MFFQATLNIYRIDNFIRYIRAYCSINVLRNDLTTFYFSWIDVPVAQAEMIDQQYEFE